MNHSEKIIKKLVDLAIHHYQERLKPHQYAASAAYAFATETATAFDTDSAHAAAFVAAMEWGSANIYYTHQLAHVTNEESKARVAMKNYGIQVTRDAEHSHSSNASDQFFQPIFAKHTGQSIGQELHPVPHRLTH